jgi:hypothetical protein
MIVAFNDHGCQTGWMSALRLPRIDQRLYIIIFTRVTPDIVNRRGKRCHRLQGVTAQQSTQSSVAVAEGVQV